MKLCLVLLATVVVVTTAAVVGVDLGSEVIKVGVSVRNEPIRLALNEQSSAKTTHAVVLKGDNEVYIGEGAKKHLYSKNSSTFKFMRFLLGYPATNQSHNILESLYTPIDFVENSRGGFSGKYGDKRQISVEEVFATTFRYIKQIAEKDANEHVSEYTITIPHFFTNEQIIALTDAVTMANINVTFLPQNIATALKYAKSKHDILPRDNDHHLVLFDFGATKLTTTVFAINTKPNGGKSGSIKVKSVVSDASLGGAFMDVHLAEYLLTKFKTKDHDKIRKDIKTMQRLITEAKKVKEMLSVNPSMTVHIESFWDERDFSYKLSREEFENSCVILAQRIVKVVKTALEQAGNPTIDNFELVGGASRVPFVKRVLGEFKVKLSQTLNADDDTTVGATYSPVADYSFERIIPASVQTVFGLEPLTSKVDRMSSSEFTEAKKRFEQVAAFEQKQIDEANAKNEMEEHLFELRKLNASSIKIPITQLHELLDETESWLSEFEERDWVKECAEKRIYLHNKMYKSDPIPSPPVPDFLLEKLEKTIQELRRTIKQNKHEMWSPLEQNLEKAVRWLVKKRSSDAYDAKEKQLREQHKTISKKITDSIFRKTDKDASQNGVLEYFVCGGIVALVIVVTWKVSGFGESRKGVSTTKDLPNQSNSHSKSNKKNSKAPKPKNQDKIKKGKKK